MQQYRGATRSSEDDHASTHCELTGRAGRDDVHLKALGTRCAVLTSEIHLHVGRTGGPLCPLLSLWPDGSGSTSRTFRARRASVAGRACGARYALGSLRSLRTVFANSSCRTLGSLCTVFTNRSRRTLRPLRTVFANGSRWTLGSLCTVFANRSRRTLGALWSCCATLTNRTHSTLRSCGANRTVFAVLTISTGGPSWTNWTNWTCRTDRTCCTRRPDTSGRTLRTSRTGGPLLIPRDPGVDR